MWTKAYRAFGYRVLAALCWGAIFATVRPLRALDDSAVAVNEREPLADAWWTGPLLAPSAATLPRGHFLLEPYLYDSTVQGYLDSHGARRSAPHANEFASLTYLLFGITDRLTLGVLPTFGYNLPSGSASSPGIGIGDMTAHAQYALARFREGKRTPAIAVALEETMPNARYDHLVRSSDGFGGGAWTTTIGLYTQDYFWLPNGRILRGRLNLTQSFSSRADIAGASVYGTPPGFTGSAKPGSALYADAAAEYSISRHWVLALDATYRTQGATRVIGTDLLYTSGALRDFDAPQNSVLAFAPAFEYNWKSTIGVILGARIVAAGRNTSDTVTPAVAVNFVH